MTPHHVRYPALTHTPPLWLRVAVGLCVAISGACVVAFVVCAVKVIGGGR